MYEDYNHNNERNNSLSSYSSDNTFSSGGNYSSSYQDYRYSNTYPNDFHTRNAGYSDSNKDKNNKKKGGFFKKAIGGILIGCFVGLSAGVCFYIVEQITQRSGPAAALEEELQASQEEKVQPEKAEAPEEAPAFVTESGIESTGTVTAVVTDVTNVVEEVMPSVVSITNTAVITQNFWGQTLQSENESSGSGFIVGENESELLIVSNNHVIADSDTLKVQFIDGSVVEARVKGVDSNMDLAVIAVSVEDLSEETLSSISIAKLGNSDTLKVGEPAIAIGNALGYGQSVTTGVISALNRQLEMMEEGATSSTLIQTDAAINPGNSGGALLNVRGEVIGINSNKIGGSAIEGMGYAIPISSAKPIIEQLMRRETKDKVKEENKGYLGISGLDVTSDVSRMYGMPEGVYVAQVYEGSGAAGAGILKGDIITAFDGSTVGSMSDLQGYLQYYEAGETVTVQLQRPNAGGYVEQIVEVILGKQSMFAEDR